MLQENQITPVKIQKEGIVFILFLRKYRLNKKECNPVPGNMYGVMYFKQWGHKETYLRKQMGIQRTTRNKTQ